MDSKEALEFINRLFWKNAKPILNELENAIFFGIWEGKTYAEITAKTSYSEQHIRDTGAELCKKITEDLGIHVTKRNFKNPIEYRRQEYPPEKVLPPQESLPEQSYSGANPFVPQQGRVDNLELFFNREREIRRVFEVLNSGSSVALIGEEVLASPLYSGKFANRRKVASNHHVSQFS